MRKLRNAEIAIYLTIILFILLNVAGCRRESQSAGEVFYGNVKRSLFNYITQHIGNNNVVGMSIALVDNQEVIWEKGFGYADKANGIMVTPDTCFLIGSISKLFTSTAIMQLVQEGLIDLDAPIKTYIPEFEIKSRFEHSQPITVRTLLTHHSGLPSDIFKGWWFPPGNPPGGYTEKFMELPGILKDHYVHAPPNRHFAYCNIGFSLAGIIIANVSEMNFADYMRHRVINPLDMDRTSYVDEDIPDEYKSKGYISGEEVPKRYIRDIPAGSIVSSAANMANFIKMILNEGAYRGNEILERSYFQQMLTHQNAGIAVDGNNHIGLSYWIPTLGMDIEKATYHSGVYPPFYSVCMTIPGHKIGVIVMANSRGSGEPAFLTALRAMRGMLEAKAGIHTPVENSSTVTEFSEDEMNELPGLYTGTLGYTRIKKKENHLFLDYMGYDLKMVSRTDNSIELENLGPLLTFKKFKVKEQFFLEPYYHGLATGVIEKFQPFPIPPVWMERVGEYGVQNFDLNSLVGDIAIEYLPDVDILLLKFISAGSPVVLPLFVLSETEAITYGKGRNLGMTIEAVNIDSEEIILFSGYKLKLK